MKEDTRKEYNIKKINIIKLNKLYEKVIKEENKTNETKYK